MSFASTPLGQGRRLDHHTFLNKAASTNASSQAQIHATGISRPHVLRQNINNPSASYAYGAPAPPARPPSKPERSSKSAEVEEHASDSEQPALVRYARLKQLEQGQPERTRDVGPRIVNNPPNPVRWNVKDTSVNIASAFRQAASSVIPAYDTSASSSSNANTITDLSNSMNPNDSWASGSQRKPLPRSTSVEYEKETQAVSRRLANPPSRSNLARQSARIGKTSSVLHVPDSEGEEDAPNGRGKSPFNQVMDVSRRLAQAAPTTFFLRRQSQEPEPRPASGAQSPSYDYSAEEREFQAAAQQDKENNAELNARAGIARKRTRISSDNKAYQPPTSDMDDSDDEVDADGKRRRRKARKGGATGGPLTKLPTVVYGKIGRRRRGTKESGVNEEDESFGDEQPEEGWVPREPNSRGVTPASSAPRSAAPSPSRRSERGSVPPEARPDTSINHASSLDSIPEIDEALMYDDEVDDSTEILSQRSFSVGATLGRGVHWAVSVFHAMTMSLWSALLSIPLFFVRAFGQLLDLIVFKPALWFRDINFAPMYRLVPYGVAALGAYAAWFAVNGGYVPSRPAHEPVYQPPSTEPPAEISAFVERLLNLENALSVLSVDNERTRTYIEGDAREQVRLAGRINALESQADTEHSSVVDLEKKIQTLSTKELEAFRQELSLLHVQLDEQRRKQEQTRGGQTKDIATEAKLQLLEERMGSVEGGMQDVKQILESHKPSEVEPITDVPTWLKDVIAGKTAITIKSSEGEDVSGLIDNLVRSAVKKASRDAIARPDFAMYSSGANVVPSLTSETYEIKPRGITNQVLGYFTGHSSAVGRPPVTALHHEGHNGHCWPFPGSSGQLGVVLATPIHISDVTIDHVSRDVATDLRSAPRHMELWAMIEGADNIAKYRAWEERQAAQREAAGQEEEEYPATLPAISPFMRIASFTYDAHSDDEIQTFTIPQEIQDLGIDFSIVALLVKSNWGREDFTCLYRFRVHGELLGGVPPLAPADA